MRYVTFDITSRVASAIGDTSGDNCGGLNTRRGCALLALTLEMPAIWTNRNYQVVRPMFPPDELSIVGTNKDGSFVLRDCASRQPVSSERVRVDRMLPDMKILGPDRVAKMTAGIESSPMPFQGQSARTLERPPTNLGIGEQSRKAILRRCRRRCFVRHPVKAWERREVLPWPRSTPNSNRS
jgi:hypothetical protein